MKLEISNIEFPYDLVESLRLGNLVVFVGAGASLDAPSSLPLFDALAYQVGSYNGQLPANNDVPAIFKENLKERPIPFYLEELHERKHIKVHSIVSKILSSLKGIVLGHLRSIFAMEASIGKANKLWDRLSYRRSAIEDHTQDGYNNDIDHLLIHSRRNETRVPGRRPESKPKVFIFGLSPVRC